MFGELAVDLLWDAFDGLIDDGAAVELQELGFDFNASLLHLLPKKVTATTADGVPAYAAGATRPLNVVNTDNRVLASAVRLLLDKCWFRGSLTISVDSPMAALRCPT